MALAKACDEDHRELQPLGGMDGHDPDGLFLPRLFRLSEVQLRHFQFFNVLNKVKESPVGGLLKGNGLLHQAVQVGLLLLPAR